MQKNNDLRVVNFIGLEHTRKTIEEKKVNRIILIATTTFVGLVLFLFIEVIKR